MATREPVLRAQLYVPFAFPIVSWVLFLGVGRSLEHHSLACHWLSPGTIQDSEGLVKGGSSHPPSSQERKQRLGGREGGQERDWIFQLRDGDRRFTPPSSLYPQLSSLGGVKRGGSESKQRVRRLASNPTFQPVSDYYDCSETDF